MYAVIRSAGKQHKVKKGDRLRVDSIAAAEGALVEIDEVLALHNGETLEVGKPLVASAKVQAKILSHGRGRKIIVFRF